jgi:hypothetical protein
MTQNDTEKAHDFFRKRRFFEPSGKVSKAPPTALAQAMESLGDSPREENVDKVILPGVTATTN